MAEIKTILQREDVAAVVILHEPGSAEYLNHINTTYNCMWIDLDGNARFKSSREHYKTAEERQAKISATCNMIKCMAECLAPIATNYLNLDQYTALMFKAEHTSNGHSSHTEQNN